MQPGGSPYPIYFPNSPHGPPPLIWHLPPQNTQGVVDCGIAGAACQSWDRAQGTLAEPAVPGPRSKPAQFTAGRAGDPGMR